MKINDFPLPGTRVLGTKDNKKGYVVDLTRCISGFINCFKQDYNMHNCYVGIIFDDKDYIRIEKVKYLKILDEPSIDTIDVEFEDETRIINKWNEQTLQFINKKVIEEKVKITNKEIWNNELRKQIIEELS